MYLYFFFNQTKLRFGAIEQSAHILTGYVTLLAEVGVFPVEENCGRHNRGQSLVTHWLSHQWFHHRVQQFRDAVVLQACCLFFFL